MALMRSLFEDDSLTASAPPHELAPIKLGAEDLESSEKCGVVYTKAWTIELILDLAGYTSERDLACLVAMEPSAGNGAFLLVMAVRLVESCKRHNRPVIDALSAIVAYELDEGSSSTARKAVVLELTKSGVSEHEAMQLSNAWVRTGDYLLDAPTLPRADFVIGNPPYIRLEDINPVLSSYYRELYSTMTGRADIYVAFYEAALKQLKLSGVCAFICADRWMLNQYGADLRQLVTSGYGVEAVIEMHNADAFDLDVSAYPAITIISKSVQGPVIVASANSDAGSYGGGALARSLMAVRASDTNIDLDGSGVKAARIDSWFRGSDPWPCVSPDKLALLRRLERDFRPIESNLTRTVVGIGVATGADKIFVTSNPDIVEASRLLPLAMASDADKGKVKWSGHYLVDPWDESKLVDLQKYPRLAAYYKTHQPELVRRNVGQKNPDTWFRTIDRVNHWLTPRPKLYIADIKNKLIPFLDSGETYPHHNVYFVHSYDWDMEVLGGLLLSPVAQFFVECYGVRMRGGYLRFQAQYLRRIRVPNPEDITLNQQERLIDAFRRYDINQATEVSFELYDIDHKTGELFGSSYKRSSVNSLLSSRRPDVQAIRRHSSGSGTCL